MNRLNPAAHSDPVALWLTIGYSAGFVGVLWVLRDVALAIAGAL